jgi:hemerythrin-like domain-containing protein
MGLSVEHLADEHARFRAYGNQLIDIHGRLRDVLADLREGVVADKDLSVHCLSFCTAVDRHHTAEDATVFPLLAARHPPLRTFLSELERDHRMIASLLTRLTAGASGLSRGEVPEGPLTAAVRMELDGLAAVLETHFIGEEKRLARVLSALDALVGGVDFGG